MCHSYLTILSLGFGRKQHDMKGFSSGFQSIGKSDADLPVACVALQASCCSTSLPFGSQWVT